MYIDICTYVAAEDAAICVGGELRRGPTRAGVMDAVGGEPRRGPSRGHAVGGEPRR